jgi:hypothetical protein
MLAGSTGLEPAASGVTGRRSNQLNYDPERDSVVVHLRASRYGGQSSHEGWLANRSSLACQASERLACQPKLVTVATARRRGFAAMAGNLRVTHERRLVGGTGLEPVAAGV